MVEHGSKAPQEISPHQLESKIEELRKEINAKHKPALVVGIKGEEEIVAVKLARRLHVGVQILRVDRKGDERKLRSPKIKGNIDGERVLLVVGIVKTGRSMELVRDYLEAQDARVETACIYTTVKTEKNLRPKFFLERVSVAPTFPRH